MLSLLKKQLEALGLLERRNIRDELMDRVRRLAPDHARSIGDDALSQLAELAYHRAQGYGFDQRDTIRFYLDLMVHLGSDFDTDPQYPWAAEILEARPADKEFQLNVATRLYMAARRCMDGMLGPDGRDGVASVERMVAGGLDFTPDPAADLVEQIDGRYRLLAPAKCAVVPREARLRLIQHAQARAAELRAPSATDEVLLAVLLFELGSGSLADPQFPWIRMTLEHAEVRTPRERFDQLKRRFLIYLRNALQRMK